MRFHDSMFVNSSQLCQLTQLAQLIPRQAAAAAAATAAGASSPSSTALCWLPPFRFPPPRFPRDGLSIRNYRQSLDLRQAAIAQICIQMLSLIGD